jgi:hypothetical protein
VEKFGNLNQWQKKPNQLPNQLEKLPEKTERQKKITNIKIYC